jgi:predicted dehydrogenase
LKDKRFKVLRFAFNLLKKEAKGMERIKAGVIGVGHLGKHHARVYSQIPEAELIGVHDTNSEKGKKVAKEFDTRHFENLGDLLEGIDAVSLVVPTTFHYSLACDVLDRGVDLLIEKPITETVNQAEELVSLAKSKNLVLQVGHIERFNPAFKSIENLELAPRFIESHRLAQFDPRGTDVAVILDLMIHDLDLILALVKSKVKKIEAVGVSVISESEDIANSRLTFENGCVANITSSRISARPLRKIRLFQKNSYISLDLLQRSVEIYKLVDVDSLPKEEKDKRTVVGNIPTGQVGKTIIYENPEIKSEDMLTSEIKSFLDAVKNRTHPKVSGEDGKRALELALEIVNKAKEHREWRTKP